jgi:hypothetical protein
LRQSDSNHACNNFNLSNPWHLPNRNRAVSPQTPAFRSASLQFAQLRALGLKVSDEFTVPLCRGHHRQLHQVGNEAAWWEDLKINALEIAKGLWENRRLKTCPTATQASQVPTDASQAAQHQDTSKLPNEPN